MFFLLLFQVCTNLNLKINGGKNRIADPRRWPEVKHQETIEIGPNHELCYATWTGLHKSKASLQNCLAPDEQLNDYKYLPILERYLGYSQKIVHWLLHQWEKFKAR